MSEQEPSAISHPVPGFPPSGLTDPERIALGDLAVARVMHDMEIPEDTARALVSHAAGQDRVTVEGDRQLVGLFVDERPLVIMDRARLRGVVHPGSN
jgi:hypothetical protein